LADKKYIIREPQQTKLGGWLCQIMEENQTILFENFQLSKKWAFQDAVLWLHEYTDGKLTRVSDQPQQPPQST